jgi:hypothetical protein
MVNKKRIAVLFFMSVMPILREVDTVYSLHVYTFIEIYQGVYVDAVYIIAFYWK